MSAPVDVLAVMDDERTILTGRLRTAERELAREERVRKGHRNAGCGAEAMARCDEDVATALARATHFGELLIAHDAVRAAVAKLIEADREYDAAHEAWDAIPGPLDGCVDDWDYSSPEWLRVRAAVERRAAALARCGGAQ